jgi:glycosyltransferase involved in cell wall biosynthesis
MMAGFGGPASGLHRMSPQFSICIPARERGRRHLDELLRSIENQTVSDLEVVVSDQSEDDAIERLCREWAGTLPLEYVRCVDCRGNASLNINNALRQARGRVLKPMDQDDFFHSPRALETIARARAEKSDARWGACGFVHKESFDGTPSRYQVPYFSERIIEGENTIGAAAVIFYENGLDMFFDEELIWLNDVDLYYRLRQSHGEPLVIPDTLIAIRHRPEQATHTEATNERHVRELAHVAGKHDLDRDRGPTMPPAPSSLRPSRADSIKVRLLNPVVPQLLRAVAGLHGTVARLENYRLALVENEDVLTRLANRYGADKGTRKKYEWEGDRHRYTPIYHRYLEGLRDDSIALLEIGIGGGQSISIWRDYFRSAHIYAIDVDDYSYLDGERVTTIVADQSDRRDLRRAMETIGRELDVIIDDGGHYMNQQQISLGFLFPYVKSGGLYVIEDLNTSYWPYRGFTAVYGDQPIDVNLDRTNTTLGLVRRFQATGTIESEYLTEQEREYLDGHIADCALFDTAETRSGPSHLAVFRKR